MPANQRLQVDGRLSADVLQRDHFQFLHQAFYFGRHARLDGAHHHILPALLAAARFIQHAE